MITETMQKALNDQLNTELFSAYVYLAMSSYFRASHLDGLASWMRQQAQEEVLHAMKIYDYLSERGGRVVLQAVDAPPKDWKSPLAVFESAFQHEKEISGRINELVELASREKDHATHSFLQWFVVEQVEEEDLVGSIVEKLKMVSDSPSALFILDNQLGQRGLEAEA